LSSPRVDQSARCSVGELAIRELAYPRVVQLPLHENFRQKSQTFGMVVHLDPVKVKFKG